MNELHNKSLIIVLIAIVALAWFTACEDGVSIQDTITDQSEIQLIEGQYLVIFHERWQGVRTPQVADEVRVFTDQFLRDTEIPADSVITRFEYALRGFTARIDEFKAIELRDDPRVDYVEQDAKSQMLSDLFFSYYSLLSPKRLFRFTSPGI